MLPHWGRTLPDFPSCLSRLLKLFPVLCVVGSSFLGFVFLLSQQATTVHFIFLPGQSHADYTKFSFFVLIFRKLPGEW
jgi:hypothetical protein